ncbi:hypothetical protein G6F61_014728 [Rhizopus arrhizus]|nr:hypothetical protein G6F61_014728 [Rhizopus arrhizus]
MGQPDLNFGPTTTPQQPVLSITGPMDFGVPHGTPDWFQPIMAMITSQGQRLAQLEALLKENQTLRTDLATAQRRIKELDLLDPRLPSGNLLLPLLLPLPL